MRIPTTNILRRPSRARIGSCGTRALAPDAGGLLGTHSWGLVQREESDGENALTWCRHSQGIATPGEAVHGQVQRPVSDGGRTRTWRRPPPGIATASDGGNKEMLVVPHEGFPPRPTDIQPSSTAFVARQRRCFPLEATWQPFTLQRQLMASAAASRHACHRLAELQPSPAFGSKTSAYLPPGTFLSSEGSWSSAIPQHFEAAVESSAFPTALPFSAHPPPLQPCASQHPQLPQHFRSSQLNPWLPFVPVLDPMKAALCAHCSFSTGDGDSEPSGPVSSPLLSSLDTAASAVSPPEKEKPVVRAKMAGIKQGMHKVNLVAALVRGMSVEDALVQLAVSPKRAAKTVSKVLHAAKSNAVQNHQLDGTKLVVAEAYVGRGICLKRVNPHGKGKSGVKVRGRSQLTVLVREMTEAEAARRQRAQARKSTWRKKLRQLQRTALAPHRFVRLGELAQSASESQLASQKA